MDYKLKALIVDDSDLSRLLIATAIGKVCISDEAENGLIAVNKYKAAIDAGTPYDIVFMDVVMPEMDGKEAVKEIRKIESNLGRERTTIYMVSASEMLDEIEGLVSGLLRKPASRKLLDELFQKHFGEKLAPPC